MHPIFVRLGVFSPFCRKKGGKCTHFFLLLGALKTKNKNKTKKNKKQKKNPIKKIFSDQLINPKIQKLHGLVSLGR